MKKAVAAAICMMAVGGPACAQTATATGVGISNSRSDARSTAVAVSGQGGAGGNVTIQGTQVPTATSATINNTGTTTVKNVPSVFSPGLAAAGLETCLGSVSGGGSFVGTGFSFGTTIPDPGCGARLDARTLWSMGLKRAAIARLCLNPEINKSMPEVCGQYLPQPTPYGYAVARPEVAPVGYRSYALAEGESYKGGLILLVDGKTGKDRLCKDYDAPGQKCRHWDGVKESPKLAMHSPKKGKKAAPAPAVAENTKPAEVAGTAEGK